MKITFHNSRIPNEFDCENVTKIEEQVVKHQARKYGVTKFGSDRFINGLLDLITLLFLTEIIKHL